MEQEKGREEETIEQENKNGGQVKNWKATMPKIKSVIYKKTNMNNKLKPVQKSSQNLPPKEISITYSAKSKSTEKTRKMQDLPKRQLSQLTKGRAWGVIPMKVGVWVDRSRRRTVVCCILICSASSCGPLCLREEMMDY